MANIGPEHALQTMVNKWVRNHVAQPHFFTGIDRTKGTSMLTHVREKARGLVAGTPDTLLIVPNLPAITIELKAKGKKVAEDSQQDQVGKRIQASGGLWGWCDSVHGYAALLRAWDVPLIGAWEIAAEGHDATLLGAAIRREETKTGKVSKARSPRKSGPRYVWKTNG